MPGLREEITKTFRRLSRRGDSHPSSPRLPATVIRSDYREGQQLGPYRILKQLGFGGMGHVYLALDTRLARHVALKFLSPELTSDQNSLARLQQEARTASGLNHPNILTIYEIGQLDGEHFIASEYVDGATLRVAMQRDAVDVGTALDIAGQVASALVAAHSAGVVHRDLKPGNIMIRRDGYVKVIDFGLAKQFDRNKGSTNGSLTRPGTVLGTVDYMSPEQARGDKVDHRTDLWSLGVVLYETVARQLPFEGETENHVLVAILDHPPAPLPAALSFPQGLPAIIRRALAKNPAERYQTAGEMLADLRQISQVSALGSRISSVVVSRPRSSRRRWVAAAAVFWLLVTACAVWWWAFGGRERVFGPNWLRIESARQLTFTGRTKLASLSPDGKYLAFVVGEPGGSETLYLKQVDQASEEVKIPPRKIDYEGLTFSPDSQTIFEVEKDEKLMGRLYSVPILGDRSSIATLVDVDGAISFSPSDEQFAFVRFPAGKPESLLEIAHRDGTDRKTLLSVRGAGLAVWQAWSPKGNLISAFLYGVQTSEAKSETALDLVDLQGHESRRMLPGWRSIRQPCWTPDGKILVVPVTTRSQGKNQSQLKQIALKDGQIHDLTQDIAGYTSTTMTRDGQELAAVKMERKARIWVSASSDIANGRSAPTDAAEQSGLAWADDGHVILNSQRGGFPNFWLFDVENERRVSLTNEPYAEQTAASVPGSKTIVFSSNRSGEFHIWKFDPDSNTYTQLTFEARIDDSPSVSPDGKWVVYTSWVGNKSHLYKVPVAGGPTSQVGTFLARDPEISPDGRSITCQLQDPVSLKWTIAVVPFEGQGQARIIPQAQLPTRWSPDGRSLSTVLTDARGVSNIWAIPLDGAAPRQLTHFDEEAIFAFAWSPRGDRLACLRGTLGSDVVLFKLRKER